MKEINGILDFFQNLNEFIYVADIETHELVYMNRKPWMLTDLLLWRR